MHNASGSMTGYLFQARYALLLSLEEGRRNASHAVSLEKFDDVAFENSGEPIELIQTKHHTKPGDTSDSSVDLWKTLNIWIKRVAVDPSGAADTRFVFLTTNTATDGSALSMLREVDDSRDEQSALDLLLSTAIDSDNKATKSSRDAFLDLDSATRSLLIHNIWVFDNAPNIVDMRGEIEKMLHYSAPEGQVTNFIDHLEGWWFSRVILALTAPEMSPIPLSSLLSKVSELRENFQRGGLPLDVAIDSMLPLTTVPEDDRTLVRQMNLIGVSEQEVLVTIHDYYRAVAQRSRWAREDLLLDGESEKYDRDLWDEWRRRFFAYDSNTDENCSDDAKRAFGMNIFRWANRHQKPLRNRDEIWLSAGSYQMLADIQRVGWHPDYKSLLKSEEDVK